MTRLLVCLLVSIGLVSMAFGADGEWRIGDFDNSYDEFAVARNHAGYPPAFPQDVTYRIGASEPSRDWSFVQPGPVDAWAGGRPHPFTIEFELAEVPTVPVRLVIDLVDVQGQVPTALTVRVNEAEGRFALGNGAGDPTLNDPANGREQVVSALLGASLFQPGANRIVLTSTGSWVLYDAVSLQPEPGSAGAEHIRNLTLEPTVFFRRLPDGEGLGQVVIARIETDGAPEGLTLMVEVNGEASEVAVRAGIDFGTIEQDLLIPEVDTETPVTVVARLGDETVRAEAIVKPEKHWRLYMAPSVHTDIGYTELQPRVAELHNDNTDRAIALCEQFPAFGWNLEAGWQADIYRRDRSREQCERLWKLAREGRIGIQASYLNMLTGLCSHEELNRWLYHAASLNRRYGVPLESALTTDVPTQVWSIPSTLAAAGIRYYANGINTTRGYTFTKLMAGHPFWWEGPDGSRVLTYWAPGYAHAGGPLSSMDELRKWVLTSTRNRADFPYDALFAYGGFSDNQPINERVAETAQQWADLYEYPKVVVGTNADYLAYMEGEFGNSIPVVRGDAGVYWEDGAGSTSRETALNRRAHESASAADGLFAVADAAGGRSAPSTRLSHLWRSILLFDEHTWGAWCSISNPDSAQTVGQWEIKAEFAHRADRDSQALVDEGLACLSELVATDGPALLLFNASSWPRAPEVIYALLPHDRVPADPTTGQPLPTVLAQAGEASDWVAFRTPVVPAWGYVACPLVKGEAAAAKVEDLATDEPLALENQTYRIAFDPATGGIRSLVDKVTGREWVDQTAEQGLNEYMYVSGGDGTNIVDIGANKPADLTVHRPTIQAWSRRDLPGLGTQMTFKATCTNTPQIATSVTLWDGCPWVEIFNGVDRTEERKKEAVYFAFPFALTRPDVRLEIPNAVMRPEIDQLPGACRDWYAVQHFARLTDGRAGVAWSSPDAPLVCLGDINRGLWQEKLDVGTGRLYSYAMNNYWFTNYKAGQSGPVAFAYQVSTRAGRSDAQAARFGWQRAMPIRSRVIPAAQSGHLGRAGGSFCRVSPSAVFITAIKRPEVGSGLVVRLFSYADKPVTARLKTDLLSVSSAELCNLLEEPVAPLAIGADGIEVRVRPQAPTTVRLR